MEIFLNYTSPFPDFSKLVMQPSESKGMRSHYNQHDILLEAYVCYEVSEEVAQREGNHTFKLKSHIYLDQDAKFIYVLKIKYKLQRDFRVMEAGHKPRDYVLRTGTSGEAAELSIGNSVQHHSGAAS